MVFCLLKLLLQESKESSSLGFDNLIDRLEVNLKEFQWAIALSEYFIAWKKFVIIDVSTANVCQN